MSAEQARLAHGSSLLAGAQSSLEALTEAEGAALAQISAVAARLRSLSEHDGRLRPIVELLESAEAQAGEAVRGLRHYAERVDLDPEALRQTEARIEVLHAAARKHRVRPEALGGRLAELEKRLAELELAVNPEALTREVASSQRKFMDLATRLSAKRAAAAQALSKSVTTGMQQLAMAGGRFSVSLAASWRSRRPGGAEEVEFEVASHPSLPLRPLAKVASGGELSRISLAIQMVAAKASPVATLVFDEVDSGIGGAVGRTIGRSLRELGKERQVLCVTHLAAGGGLRPPSFLGGQGGHPGRVGVRRIAARSRRPRRRAGAHARRRRKHGAPARGGTVGFWLGLQPADAGNRAATAVLIAVASASLGFAAPASAVALSEMSSSLSTASENLPSATFALAASSLASRLLWSVVAFWPVNVAPRIAASTALSSNAHAPVK